MALRLRSIELVYYVMRTGSLRQAAEALNVSQPAASKALRYAEQSLGFALFDRVRGRLVPTREAQIMLPRITALFDQFADLSRLAENLRTGRGGHELSIGCVPSLGLSVVPRVINRYREKSGDNMLSVDTLHGAEIIAGLRKRDLDFGIIFGVTEEPGLICEALAEIPLVLLDSTAAEGAVRLETIDPARWIGLADHDPTSWALSSAWKKAGWEVSPAIRVRTHYMAAELARLGAGWAIVDAFTALHDSSLPTARRLDPPMTITCSAVYREDHALRRIARSFTQILRQEFTREMARL